MGGETLGGRNGVVVREFRLHVSRLLNTSRSRLAPPARPRNGMARLAQDIGPPDRLPEQAPIFVLGSGWRTGSTLVQRMLNEVPDVLIWGEPFSEGAIVQRMADSLAFLDAERGRFHGRILPDDGRLPDAETWTANLTPPLEHLAAAQRAMLDRLFGPPALKHGKSRWGVKEVVWGRDVIDLLALLYPGCRMLLLVRDPITQWRSYRPATRRPWFYRWPEQPIGTPSAFARMWNQLALDFSAAARDHPQATVVRYEDLRDEAELDRLSHFLDLAEPLTGAAPQVGSSRDRALFRDSVPAWERAVVKRLTASGARRCGYR